MRSRSLLSVLALVLVVAGVPSAAAEPAFEHLRLVAPAAPGGGWDQTARAMQQVLQRAGIARTASVENIPGAAGLIGLARFIGAEQGNGDTLMASGLIMLGAIVTQRSAVTFRDVTPIARLTGEYEILAVPASSPFRTLDDFIRAFKARPESISWGGGSAGGSDQILAGLIADTVGVDPRRVNYIAFSGGGEALSAILGGQVSVGINGLAEFAAQIEAGTVRVLGISSAERLSGLEVPTLREQGIDIEFENWRAVVAPPGLTPDDRRRLEATVDAMVRSDAWRETLERFRWIDRYLAREPFVEFLAAEEARVQDILTRLGTDDENAPTVTAAGPYPIIVLAGLVLTGLAVLLSSYVGRGSRAGEASARSPGVEWRPVALIAAALVLDLLLAERAGFVIASAVLFWFVARAFDPRHPLRDAAFAVAVSTGAYLLFGRVLDLPLPAGVLSGLL
ncbi:MAG: tripartite tricarboxylate transporter TctB family protein [Acidobacteria bacterium]|nr:tripartite tricarboxylate transporter TctB family protein [Acidobacteriota bacterium]